MRLPIADNATTWRKFGALLMERKGFLSVVVVLQLVFALAGVIVPTLVGRAVDAVSSGTDIAYIKRLVVITGAIVAIQLIIGYAANYLAQVFSQHMLARLRSRVVRAITHMPLGMVESAGSGDMIGRTTSDIGRITVFIEAGLSRMVVIVLTLVVTVVAMLITSPVVGGAALLVACLSGFSIRFYLRRAMPAYLAATSMDAGRSGLISETIEQADTVDFLNLGAVRARRLDTVLKEIWNNELYTAWTRDIFIGLMQITISLPVITSAIVGAFMLGNGGVTYGIVASIALYAVQLRQPIWALGWWLDEMQFSLVALRRIFGVEEGMDDARVSGAEESIDDSRLSSTGTAFAPAGSEVVLNNVRFSYDAGDEVLHGVSLEVRAGETIAVVGPSGAGKSTIGRLVAGINPPATGSVTIGGVEVSEMPESMLHRAVAMVSQEHHVFVGTLADNLRLARTDANEEEMREALAAVGATEWAAGLENGLETKVGSGGLVLTPAQAQQLALARIVLLDPAVLVLDEATSLIDPTAARSLERSLARVLEGRTVISIAHRLYTAHDADRVAVVMDGRVVEFGSHDELVATGGEYSRLWQAWQQD